MAQLELALSPELVFVVEIELDKVPAARARMQQQGRTPPPPVRRRALIDTGASVCAASAAVVRALSLPSASAAQQQITTAGGGIQSQTYYASLRVPALPGLRAEFASLNQFSFGGAPFEVILGMNVLMRWNWSYRKATQKLVSDDSGLVP